MVFVKRKKRAEKSVLVVSAKQKSYRFNYGCCRRPLSGEVQPRVVKMAPQSRSQKVKKCVSSNLLTLLTVGGVVGGGVIGFTLRASKAK